MKRTTPHTGAAAMRRCLGLILLAAAAMAGCGGRGHTPRPQAYIRIDMPPHAYRPCDTAALPFTFDISSHASVEQKRATPREVWLDIAYSQWDAVVFLSYKRLASPADLRGQTDTSLRLLENHYQFASGVAERGYTDEGHRVYANVCRLKGAKVASTCQFWATDSVANFLRGAFYLDRTPNNDSLAPVIEFVQADIDRLVESLRWRTGP